MKGKFLKQRVLVWMMWCSCAGALAAEPNLDELQRRLDAARREQQKSSAAASAPKPAAVRQATLVVRSDSPCRLSVDGKPLAELSAGVTRSLSIVVGEALVECQSSTETDAKYSTSYKFDAGTKVVLQIELQDKILAARQRRDAAARQAEAAAAGDKKRVAPPTLPSTATAAPSAPAPAVSTLPSTASSRARIPAVAASQQAEAPSPSAQWNQIRTSLRAARGNASLSGALSVMLDAKDRPDEELLSQFEALTKRWRWNNALAMGVRNGYISYGWSTWQTRLDFAEERALGNCRSDTSCVLIMVNGKLREDGIAALAEKLGSKSPAAVREAVLPGWRQMVAAGI